MVKRHFAASCSKYITPSNSTCSKFPPPPFSSPPAAAACHRHLRALSASKGFQGSMGRTRDGDGARAAPATSSLSSFPSPSSSSSSDFEFTVALSPSSKRPCAQLCPADELFYKGQLLPLHLSPRISLVRTLLLASSSTSSSSDTTTTASRDSNGSTSSSSFSAADFLPECDSSRPSSVTEEEARRVTSSAAAAAAGACAGAGAVPKRGKYLSSFATRLSSVFLHRGSKKDAASGADLVINLDAPAPALASAKKANVSSSSAAKEVIKKCVKKVKPLYEKLSSLQQKQTHLNGQHHPPPPPPPPHHHHQHQQKKTFSFSIRKERFGSGGTKKHAADPDGTSIAHHSPGGIYGAATLPLSFSGNLGKPRRKQWAASCPSSMRSSPSHSGLLSVGGAGGGFPAVEPPSSSFLLSSSSSSMEELQSAIQGAIAHCKSSMSQGTTQSSNKKASTGAASSSSSNKEQDEISRS